MCTVPQWPQAPSSLPLAPDQVHVWLAVLGEQEPRVEALREVLDEEERARAERFAFESDRRRFIVAHVLVREVLARYLSCDPAELAFCFGPQGKPALVEGGGLEFNMSHSGDLILCAVSRGRAVGVDVEQVRADAAGELTAARFFTPTEVDAIRAAPEGERACAFTTVWARKEACLKATGKGLTMPLNAFTVWPNPEPPWRLVDLDVGPQYAAALATQGGDWMVVRYRWRRR